MVRQFVVVVFLFVSSFHASLAQQPIATEDIRALDRVIGILEDETARGRLAEQLKALRTTLAPQGQAQQEQAPASTGAQPAEAPASSAGEGAANADAAASPATPGNGEKGQTPDDQDILTETGLMGAVSGWMGDIAEGLPNAALGAPIGMRLEQARAQIMTRLAQDNIEHSLGDFFGRAAIGWVAAILAWYILHRMTRRALNHTLDKCSTEIPKARAIVFIVIATFLPAIAAWGASAAIAWSIQLTPRNAQLASLLPSPVILACFAQRLLWISLALLKRTRGRRLTDYARRVLMPWITAIVGLASLSSVVLAPPTQFTIGWASAALISLALDLTVASVALIFVFKHRRTVRALIIKRGRRHEEISGSVVERVITTLGNKWHLLAYAFLTLNVLARVLGTGTGSFVTQAIVSVVVVAVSLAAMSTVEKRLDDYAERSRTRWRQTTQQVILGRAARLAKWLLQAAIIAVAAGICLSLWGLNLWVWVRSAEGAAVIAPLMSIAVAVFTAWLIWISLDAWIEVTLSHKGQGWNRSSRVQTLLPLLRNFAFVVLTVLTFIAVLANLGINVAPLLAGAGVVGLAIGFGSQQLVQDVITGLFILLEDTLAIGDVVDTGDRVGTVEALTIRTVKIRDGDGALHSIPFSSIKALKNSSRDFGVYFVNLTIDPRADAAKAIEAIKEAGRAVEADPRFSRVILQPLDVWGVDQITPDGVIIKGAIRTRPLQQWAVGREINRLAKAKLEEAGVALATRMGMQMMPAAAG